MFQHYLAALALSVFWIASLGLALLIVVDLAR